MPFFSTSDGVELFFESEGSGPVIVLTHGASWDHHQWQPQVEALREHFRVITWDVRGHGQSGLPAGPVNPNDFRHDLVVLLDHLGIEQAVLGGLSMGGHISLQTAACYPQRAAGLVLIGTPFTNSFNLYEKIAVPINRFSQRLMPMSWIAWSVGAYLGGKLPHVRQYAIQAIRQISHERWIKLWDAVTRMESRHLLSQIHCPTLLLQGQNDALIGRQQQALAAAIPQAEFKLVPDAGHATNLENPGAVNALIAGFLRQVYPSTQPEPG